MTVEQRNVVHPRETRPSQSLSRAIDVNRRVLGLDGSQASGSEIRKMLLDGVEASERQAFDRYDTQALVPALSLAVIPKVETNPR